VADAGDNPRKSFADRARGVLSNVEQDDRFKQAAAATKEAAQRAQEASKSVSRKVAQEDAWDELRGDMQVLTEITRAHHALIVDLIDRVDALEEGSGHGG
jgi:DNA repair ATPase RecN